MICPTGSHKPTNTIVLGFIRALLLKARVFGADSRVFLTFDPEERLYAAPTWLRVHICVYVFTTCQPRGSHVVPAWFPRGSFAVHGNIRFLLCCKRGSEMAPP
jgi:hypothetical protein